MSYCVNCGVELDASLGKCPLCNTPVINPSKLEEITRTSPYPKESGQVDVVKRKDLAVLSTISLTATSLCCLFIESFCFFPVPLVFVYYRRLPAFICGADSGACLYPSAHLHFPVI